ncbi:MAG: hypothetical protein JJU31_16630 [Wenzhouxiangella sp.]|nr:hypothetical protein [Wenzhouxiangella sp.]TVR93561.1 MAG: hypothetical protein EA418_11830 [Wenzhouxiangellaceae bacterium]
MSPRWSKLLERLGKPLGQKAAAPDIFADGRVRQGLWHEFRDWEALYQLYGPESASPWQAFHCPTLFAGIDRLRLQPRFTELAPEVIEPQPTGAWQWLGPDCLVLVDLPGGISVQLAVRMLTESPGGAQLVSAFDHWPAANPVRRALNETSYVNMAPLLWPPRAVDRSVAIDSMDVINSMVTLAPQVYQRRQAGISADAPGVWMCDSRRLVAMRPGPGNFDNRYYIDDSILPGPALLASQNISRVVLVSLSIQNDPADDLCSFLHDCHGRGVSLSRVALESPETWALPVPMAPPKAVRLAGWKYPKSQVGGFGVKVPVPSESSGGSFAGAGG